MKNFCILPILIFIVMMLAYQCATAQDYVVTARRDTLRGDLKPILYGPEKKVQVVTRDNKKTILPITQTLGYFYNGETFQPVRSDKGYVFMKLLKTGYLSLYAFQMENQLTFDGLYLVKKDGSRVEVPNLSFKKIMTHFLQDCDGVSARISEGDLNKKDLNQIVDEYNQCIDSKTSYATKAIVQKKEQSIKMGSWDILEEKVKAEADFEGKKNALDMITEIKGKISRSEKIPSFLLEGLKNSMAKSTAKEALETALKEVN